MRACRWLPASDADTDLYKDTDTADTYIGTYMEFEGEQGHGYHRNHHCHRRYGHFI